MTQSKITNMKKILLISDSHGNSELRHGLLNEYPLMDFYLDAGDSQEDQYSIYPFDSVKGNCDYYDFDQQRFLIIDEIKILMTHKPILDKSKQEDADILIHGHTHKYEVKEIKNKLIVCPGSISSPRDGSNGTYAIINISNKRINVDIIDVISKKSFITLLNNIKLNSTR